MLTLSDSDLCRLAERLDSALSTLNYNTPINYNTPVNYNASGSQGFLNLNLIIEVLDLVTGHSAKSPLIGLLLFNGNFDIDWCNI